MIEAAGCMQVMVCGWGRSRKRTHRGTSHEEEIGCGLLALSERLKIGDGYLLGEIVATAYECATLTERSERRGRKADLSRYVW